LKATKATLSRYHPKDGKSRRRDSRDEEHAEVFEDTYQDYRQTLFDHTNRRVVEELEAAQGFSDPTKFTVCIKEADVDARLGVRR